MRILKGVAICLLILATVAVAKDNKLGIHEVSNFRFETQVHIGANVLPAGDYVIRHTMQGEEHIMVFKRQGGGEEVKVKCTLVALPKSSPQTQAVYQMSAGNKKVLQELVFRGDTSKHVF